MHRGQIRFGAAKRSARRHNCRERQRRNTEPGYCVTRSISARDNRPSHTRLQDNVPHQVTKVSSELLATERTVHIGRTESGINDDAAAAPERLTNVAEKLIAVCADAVE